ncbi:helix-turn-helix transcriptional regulator [Paractinoplanes deccanensis]|uniref:Helix-turn-helix transcriptional regulator n=1 Tax=Paractinoplanes deccanensis TaxID=113561 RepID=A0ABQ3Y4K8_9ACTN|nr:LuxR family transcriptional regulator [Actinoplanes deccanensis]GID74927.1 helix-turn-helix transcriptional regulator [Actinoplanes deccanensis]
MTGRAGRGTPDVSRRLVGRDAEVAFLTRVLDDTAAGAGGCHAITGAPGIGKSALLHVAIRLATGKGVAVATREAFRLDQAAPLVTLAGALRDCSPATPAFAWLAERAPERADPFGALQRLRASLEEAARERPLLIVIDDAQWMDELSALAVRELIPALASSPVRWLFAHRPPAGDDRETPGHQLMQWLQREGVSPLRLGVLDDSAIAQLSADVVGADVDNTVVALAASCLGNPLRTEQLIKALVATHQLVVADGIGSVVGDDLPSSFVDSVREVLDTLSEPAAWLLRSVAVFGRPFTFDEAGRLTAHPPADLYPLVREAMADFLVEDAGGGLAFAHDLVRQAVYNTLPRAMREQLHRQVAAISRDADRPALEVAEHQLKSGRTGAGDAVRMVRSMAREIARVAPGAAADLMLRALAAADPADPGRPALIADTVGLLAAAARLEEARELGGQALEAGLDPQTEALLLLGLAEACKHSGLNEMTVRYSGEALRHEGLPLAVEARLHAVRAHALCYLGRLAEADESGARADELGRQGGEYGAAVFGTAGRSLVAYAEGRLANSLEHARAATALADREGGDAAQRHPRIWLGGALTVLDHFDEAEQVIRAGRRESDRYGSSWAEPLWHYFQTSLLYARGRLEEAAVEADSGLTVAERHNAHALAMPLLGMLLRVAVLRGDLAAARDHLDHVRRLAAGGVTAVPEDVLWAEALLLDAEGAPSAAFSLLRDFYPALPERPALLAGDPASAAELVRIARDAGRPEEASAAVRAAELLAARNPGSRSAAGAAAHARGVQDKDLDRLQQAADLFRAVGRPLPLAAALEDAAMLGRGSRDDRAVRSWCEEALTIVTDCGAHRARGRIEDVLGGWVAVPPEPAAAAETCLPQLTPAERKVALEVGKGRTNIQIAEALYISKHTVDAHLRNIFGKLSIRRRAELAAVVARECAG